VFCTDTFEPPAFVAVRLILQFPTPNTADWFCTVPNTNHVLLPGVMFIAPHDHDVGVFELVSLNITDTVVIPPVAFAVNDDTGDCAPELTLTHDTCVDILDIADDATPCVIVKLPVVNDTVGFCAVENIPLEVFVPTP
jgi:hypothetical protein